METKKRNHYLYSSWYWMNKQQQRHTVDPAWVDFFQYVADVGERPSKNHRLHKLDSSLGYVKGNVVWREQLNTNPTFTTHAASWNARNTAKIREHKLKTRYNISQLEYNNLLQKQKNSCAICGKVGNGNKAFAVDHDHTTGKVRGLLCDSCNLGLGKLGDNIQSIEQTLEYLKGFSF